MFLDFQFGMVVLILVDVIIVKGRLLCYLGYLVYELKVWLFLGVMVLFKIFECRLN